MRETHSWVLDGCMPPYFDPIIGCHQATSSSASVDLQAPYSASDAPLLHQRLGLLDETLTNVLGAEASGEDCKKHPFLIFKFHQLPQPGLEAVEAGLLFNSNGFAVKNGFIGQASDVMTDIFDQFF